MVLARVAEYFSLKESPTISQQDERHGDADTGAERAQQDMNAAFEDDEMEEARPAYTHVRNANNMHMKLCYLTARLGNAGGRCWWSHW